MRRVADEMVVVAMEKTAKEMEKAEEEQEEEGHVPMRGSVAGHQQKAEKEKAEKETPEDDEDSGMELADAETQEMAELADLPATKKRRRE